MLTWLRKWFPIDDGPRSPARHVVDHVLGALLVGPVVAGVRTYRRFQR